MRSARRPVFRRAALAALAEACGRRPLAGRPAKFLPERRGSAMAGVDLLGLATHAAGGFALQLPEGSDTPDQLTAYYRGWTRRSRWAW